MSTSPCPLELFRQFPGLLSSFWRRQRGSLGPRQVLMSLMVMSVLGTKGYERTIEEMKQYLGEVLNWTTPESTPTGQALSQARRKLTPERCREVALQVHALCTTARERAALGYGGFRLLAQDHQPAITVRLLRKVLPNGTPLVFITSLLDAARHPAHILIDLYTNRWRVETAFRELKIWHGLERFHARYVDGIYQEITALMLFQLLASELEAKARVHHGLPTITPTDPPATITQPTIRFNRRIVADCAVSLLFAAAKGDQQLKKQFDYCLFRIWRYRQTITKGRSFVRERKSPARGWKDKHRKGSA